ncbi:hypothetical protein [Paenibacillus gansuensis]|uniref:Uncharacterized protein n=1 Tax=Paenibacillus gansuensis TaxID=306542 RepID=A0ABW5PBY0_9BACL
MTTLELLIQKVSKFVIFSNPVTKGNVLEQRPADPRLPIRAFFVILKESQQDAAKFNELWLKQDGNFAVTEIGYETDIRFVRSLLIPNLKTSEVTELFPEHQIIERFSTLLQKHNTRR